MHGAFYKKHPIIPVRLTFEFREVRLLCKPVLDVLQVPLTRVHILVQLLSDERLHVYIRLYKRHLQQGKEKYALSIFTTLSEGQFLD
jgi:hypothetical protein